MGACVSLLSTIFSIQHVRQQKLWVYYQPWIRKWGHFALYLSCRGGSPASWLRLCASDMSKQSLCRCCSGIPVPGSILLSLEIRSGLCIPMPSAKGLGVGPRNNWKWQSALGSIGKRSCCQSVGTTCTGFCLKCCPTTAASLAAFPQQLDCLARQIQRKRLNHRPICFLHDSTSLHVASITSHKYLEMGWGVLIHPLYSPGPALFENQLFLFLTNALRHKRFSNEHDLKPWLEEFFLSKPKTFYCIGPKTPPKRWWEEIGCVCDFLEWIKILYLIITWIS